MMMRLIEHPKKAVRKEVVWSISNITAGQQKQVEMTIECGLFDKLIYLMLHDDPAIRREAIWAVANATASCNEATMHEMVNRNIIQALGIGLKFEEPRSIFVALEGLSKVLAAGVSISREENPFALIAEQYGLVDSLEEL